MSRFDHSSLDDLDLTAVDTGLYKMEYIVHFQGAARPADLPLLGYTRVDTGTCGKRRSNVFWGWGRYGVRSASTCVFMSGPPVL